MKILIFLGYKKKGDAIYGPPSPAPNWALWGACFACLLAHVFLFLSGSAWNDAAWFFLHGFVILQKKLAMFFEFKFFFI
jgi:hypothetical protein